MVPEARRIAASPAGLVIGLAAAVTGLLLAVSLTVSALPAHRASPAANPPAAALARA